MPSKSRDSPWWWTPVAPYISVPVTHNSVLSCSPRHSPVYSSQGSWEAKLSSPGPAYSSSSALAPPPSQVSGDRESQHPLNATSALRLLAVWKSLAIPRLPLCLYISGSSDTRKVFRTSFLQVPGFLLPEHHLCLQPSRAHFGADTVLLEWLPSHCPDREGPAAAPGCSCSTHSPEKWPCPAPRQRSWEKREHSCLEPILYQLISFWTNITMMQQSKWGSENKSELFSQI